MSVLSGPVQVLNIPHDQIPPIQPPTAAPALPVALYTPDGFVDVETDAALVAQDGMWALVHTGTEYRLIRTDQIKRTVSARQHEAHELFINESAQYARSNRWKGVW